MAHWAQLDDKNIVIQVTVGDNNDPNGDEGYKWLIDNIGGKWVKTSYNTYGDVHLLGGEPFRKNYAGIGYTYDEARDAFISPKPHDSWLLDEKTCNWIAPVEYPSDGVIYEWDEEQLDWTPINFSE